MQRPRRTDRPLHHPPASARLENHPCATAKRLNVPGLTLAGAAAVNTGIGSESGAPRTTYGFTVSRAICSSLNAPANTAAKNIASPTCGVVSNENLPFRATLVTGCGEPAAMDPAELFTPFAHTWKVVPDDRATNTPRRDDAATDVE